MEKQNVDEELDLVVVGGGTRLASQKFIEIYLPFWYTGINGICALKTYLALNPSSSVALLDSRLSLGGVWARERLYAGIKTNNVLGGYEFSDFAMDSQKFNVGYDQHIPGEVVHEYLEAYCEEFGLGGYIKLGWMVESITRDDDHNTGSDDSGSWIVQAINQTEKKGKRTTTNIRTKKLIMATGLTSQPYMPQINGQENYQRPHFHFVDFKTRQPELLDKKNQNITVFGSAKSAFDAAYLLADAGLSVDMIIRASGHGPSYMSPARVTPLKKLIERLVNVRLLTWFSPCIWGGEEANDYYSLIRRALHGTWLGRKIVDIFWWILGNDMKTLNNYDSHPETAKLKPWVGTMWIASGLGIFNYDGDVLEMVRNGKIKIHIADIDSLSEGQVHLSNGQNLPSDAMVCCTGWDSRPNIRFFPEGIETQLGLPGLLLDSLPEETLQNADAHILGKLPRLKDQPKNPSQDSKESLSRPLRLYRFMVPCSPHLASSRSIVFVGMAMTVSTMMITQTQALWAAAYLSGTLDLPSQTDMQWATALHTQFCKLRYGVGANGKRVPDFVFDAVPYIDMLLNDLKLNGKRKESRLKEWFEPYVVGDYKGIVEEYLEKMEADKKHV